MDSILGRFQPQRPLVDFERFWPLGARFNAYKTWFRMGGFCLDTYPDSLNAWRCELRDIGLGDGILPASLENKLRRADSEIPRFAFDRDEATRAQTEAIVTALPSIDRIQALMTSRSAVQDGGLLRLLPA
ncbi:hypothetical protein QQZ08_004606 [Neonectria magnoliae]|uniref:Uncharacterized protein n=1 Tax=Neonectria magnoliae TaxID=2732573 RepID=A0ABR1I7L6_9HYPO